MKQSTPEIYYLPGAGGLLDKGLGAELMRRGHTVAGRESTGTFKRLRFSDQVEIIREDLEQHFWHSDATVIANSFGAYLFLHAQLELPPFPGRVLLLSPVIGSAKKEGTQFFLPRSERLQQSLQEQAFPSPIDIEVHVGSEDWQAGPDQLIRFCEVAAISVHVAPGRGHLLGSDYVKPLLDRWL